MVRYQERVKGNESLCLFMCVIFVFNDNVLIRRKIE